MAVLPLRVNSAGAVDEDDDSREARPEPSVGIIAADEADRMAFEVLSLVLFDASVRVVWSALRFDHLRPRLARTVARDALRLRSD